MDWSRGATIRETDFVASVSDFDVSQLDRSPWFGAARKVLKFWCKFNGFNITKNQDDKEGRKVNFKRQHWLPLLIRLVLVILTIKLVMSTYRSYQFDFCRVRYSRYEARNSTDNKTLIEMKQKMEEARQSLTGLGKLYENTTFIVEVWEIYLAGSILHLYFYLYIAFACFIDIHYTLGAIIVDFEASRRSYLRIVSNQLRRFIISNRNFHQTQAEEDVRFTERSGTLTSPLRGITCRHQNQHKQFVDSLRASLSAGRFGPLTWRYDWLRRMGLMNLITTISMWLYTIPLTFIMFVGLPMATLGPKQKFDWWHLTRFGDELATSALSFTMGSFYLPIMIISPLDHQRHLDKLIELVRVCKTRNTVRFACILDLIRQQKRPQHQIRQTNTGATSSTRTRRWNIRYLASQINHNLLFVLVHYRIYVIQSRSIEKTSRVFMIGGITLLFLVPILNLLHGPYMKLDIFSYVCVGHIILFNLMVVPLCRLHSKASVLCRSLSGLLAHSIGCQASSRALGEPDTYDDHLIGLLRKELDDHDIIETQFSIVVMGIPVTYPNLLQIHFWFGLLMLLVIMGTTSRRGDLFGHFIADPFGLL